MIAQRSELRTQEVDIVVLSEIDSTPSKLVQEYKLRLNCVVKSNELILM